MVGRISAPPKVAQDTIDPLGYKDTLLAHDQIVLYQHLQMLFYQAVLHLDILQHLLGFFPRFRALHFPFVKLHETPVSPSLQPVKVKTH